MKTELVLGNIRIRFESRTRRRRFVAFVYAALAVFCIAWCSFNPKETIGALIISGVMILGTALMIVFSSITGDMYAHGDEREMHRRADAYFKAYSLLGKFAVAALFAGTYFRGYNPIAPLLPVALRGGMVQWPYVLLMATGILYFTLPPAMLLWTEPDMELEA
jgi:hypothetical protein